MNDNAGLPPQIVIALDQLTWLFSSVDSSRKTIIDAIRKTDLSDHSEQAEDSFHGPEVSKLETNAKRLAGYLATVGFGPEAPSILDSVWSLTDSWRAYIKGKQDNRDESILRGRLKYAFVMNEKLEMDTTDLWTAIAKRHNLKSNPTLYHEWSTDDDGWPANDDEWPTVVDDKANGEERAAFDEQPIAGTTETDALTPEDLAILVALRSSLTTLTYEELENPTELSARTLGKKVTALMKRGLVVRPHGPKKGCFISEKGRIAIAHVR